MTNVIKASGSGVLNMQKDEKILAEKCIKNLNCESQNPFHLLNLKPENS